MRKPTLSFEFLSLSSLALKRCVGLDIEKQVVRELGTIVGRIAHNILRVGKEFLATLQIALPVKTVAADVFAAAYTAACFAEDLILEGVY